MVRDDTETTDAERDDIEQTFSPFPARSVAPRHSARLEKMKLRLLGTSDWAARRCDVTVTCPSLLGVVVVTENPSARYSGYKIRSKEKRRVSRTI